MCRSAIGARKQNLLAIDPSDDNEVGFLSPAIAIERVEECLIAKPAGVEILLRRRNLRAAWIGEAELVEHRRMAQQLIERLVRIDSASIQARAIAKNQRIAVTTRDLVG